MNDVKRIVEIINKEGRQGPKDLKSIEVYNWVLKKIKISYEEYKRILDENAINEEDRLLNRNAFFIIEKNGKYQLFKSKEDEIRKYICYIIRENPNITSAEARKKFKYLYKDYTIVDLMDQKNLSSNQDIIDQTIRNIMVSNYYKKKNYVLFYRSESKPFTYTIKDEGLKLSYDVDELLAHHQLIDSIQEEQNDSIDNFEINKGIEFYSDEELKEMHIKNQSFNFYDAYDFNKYKYGRIPTDYKIKTTRFKQTNFKCEINHGHITFPTITYPNYLEGHHFVPISAQRNFSSTNLDCIENMVSLCPVCHSQIHYGTRNAKLEIFNKIIEKRKEDFRSIGFTEEILKVVFDIYY